MNCWIRRQVYTLGDYKEVNIYSVFGKKNTRSARRHPSSEVQQKLNETNSTRHYIRLVHANMTTDDYFLRRISYRNDNRPTSVEEAEGRMKNFIRRLKRIYARAGITLKFLWTTEISSSGKYHHHMFLTGGVSRDEIENCWGFGTLNCERLEADEHGFRNASFYLSKAPCGRQRYHRSRNLVEPQPVNSDNFYTKRRFRELCEKIKNGEYIPEEYDGYYLGELPDVYRNLDNNADYVHLWLVKNDAEIWGKKRKKKGRTQ